MPRTRCNVWVWFYKTTLRQFQHCHMSCWRGILSCVKRCDFPAPKPGTGPCQTWSYRISSQGFGLKTATSPSCKWRDQNITVTLLCHLKQSLYLFFYNKLELKYLKKNISSLMTCAIGSKGIGFSKPLWRVENMLVLSLLGKSRPHIP